MKNLLLLIVSILMLILPGYGQWQAKYEWQNPKYSLFDNRDVDFFNDSVGIIVGRLGSMRTTNGGKTWTKERPSDFPVSFNTIHCLSTNHGWIGGATVKKTADAGQTWTQVNLPQALPFDIRDIFMVSDSIVFLLEKITDQGIQIWKTTDEGHTWTHTSFSSANFLLPDPLTITFSSDSIGWVLAPGGLFYKTVDQGTHWVKQTGFPPDFDFLSISLINDTTGFLCAAPYAQNPTAFKTIDGESWTMDTSMAVGMQLHQANNTLWAGNGFIRRGHTGGVLIQSSDGGRNWKAFPDLSYSVIGTLYNNRFKVVTDSIWIIVADNGVLLRTENAGLTFESSSVTSTDINSISFASQTGLAVGYDGSLLITRNEGHDWKASFDVKKGILNDVKRHNFKTAFAFNDSLLWACSLLYGSDTALICGSTNSGESWDTLCLLKVKPAYSASISFDSQTHGRLLVGRVLFETPDGGRSWHYLSSLDSTQSNWKISFPAPDLAVGIADGKISRTVNGGRSWEYQSFPRNTHLLQCVHFVNQQIGWVGIIRGDIDTVNGYITPAVWSLLRTNNGGINWNEISSIPLDSVIPQYSWYNAMSFKDSLHGCMVGNQGQIATTHNGGYTWDVRYIEPYSDYRWQYNYSLNSVCRNTQGGTWVGGTKGLIIRLDPDVITGAEGANIYSPGFTAYPNPASTQINILSPNPGPIDLFNLQGKKVHTVAVQKGNASTFSIAHLPKGLYLLRQGGLTTRFVKE